MSATSFTPSRQHPKPPHSVLTPIERTYHPLFFVVTWTRWPTQRVFLSLSPPPCPRHQARSLFPAAPPAALAYSGFPVGSSRPSSRAHRNKRNCASLYIVEKSAYYPNLITVQNYIIFLTLPNISPYIFALPCIFHYYSLPRAPKVTKRQPWMAASSFYLVGIHHIFTTFAAAQG